MPIIKNKSVGKSDAAQYLINGGFYTESVHCIYYSSFLFMKYILHHIPSEKKRVAYNKQVINGAGSHESVFKLLQERIDSEEIRKQVAEIFQYLKKKRNIADYSAELIPVKETYAIKKKAELLKRILIKTFGKL